MPEQTAGAASAPRSAWSLFQNLMTIVTPILVVVLGIVLNRDITRIETQIANVEAMGEFFEMMSSDDEGKAKMAAYALYMLNRNEPEMAVSVLLAPDKEFLKDVLTDLATRDKRFEESLEKVVATDGELGEVETDAQQRAWSVIDRIRGVPVLADVGSGPPSGAAPEPDGWCYVGTRRGDAWTEPPALANEDGGDPIAREPEHHDAYRVTKDLRLRAGYPDAETGWRMKTPVGVVRAGSTVQVLESRTVGRGRVWAQVAIEALPPAH